MHKKIAKILGFTLIEILFVIAILSVIASFGLSVLQKRSQQLKIEKTALQMQQIFQAALAYKVDNGKWPWNGAASSPAGDVCLDSQDQTKGMSDFAPYLTFQLTKSGSQLTNPWGLSYQCVADGSSAGKKFSITVQAPNSNVATEIAALLPNAIVQDSSVSSKITGISGGSSDTPPVQIVKISEPVTLHNVDFINGIAKPTIPSFICNSGTGGIFVLIKNVEMGDNDPFGIAQVLKQLKLDSDSSSCKTISGSVSCSLTITFLVREDTKLHSGTYTDSGQEGSLSFQYVAYCKKT